MQSSLPFETGYATLLKLEWWLCAWTGWRVCVCAANQLRREEHKLRCAYSSPRENEATAQLSH